jgi:2-polyprenyl-3-methyl-5-hydroxy-6-metoxy-1,4-benzoquinol methylase
MPNSVEQSKKIKTMTYVACNLCGSNDYTVRFEQGVAQVNQIVNCKDCGLMYANPRVQEADNVLIESYDPEFVLASIVKQESPRLGKEAVQVKDHEKTRAFLNKHYPQKGKLIELGSGLGYLLNFFKQDGWNVVGLEPNVGLSRYAESELGIETIPTILEQAELEDRSVDVVLMMHVIEHVSDPYSTLKEIYRKLKPGGIFVMESPRYDTLMFKLFGKRERNLSCNGHIYFFTSSTLEKLVTKAGFTVLKTDYVGRSLTLDRVFSVLGVISKSQVIQKILKDVAVKLDLNKISLSLNVRDIQRIYLKKPDSGSA